MPAKIWFLVEMFFDSADPIEPTWKHKLMTYPALQFGFGQTGVDATGAPHPRWTVCAIAADDVHILTNDTEVVPFPDAALLVNQVSATPWSKVLAKMATIGQPTDWIRGIDSVGDVIDFLGKQIDPEFSHTTSGGT